MPTKSEQADALARSRDEYLDASSNARQFNVLRFAELTIFITATGALMAGSFSRAAAPATPEAGLALKLAGIVVTAVFGILQERTMLYWRHFVARAAELESELGYRQYSSRPKEGLLGGHRAVRLLFLLTGAFWVAAAIMIPTTA